MRVVIAFEQCDGVECAGQRLCRRHTGDASAGHYRVSVTHVGPLGVTVGPTTRQEQHYAQFERTRRNYGCDTGIR
jgi:hypothetical protein